MKHTAPQKPTLVLDYQLDASPEKVWRAISLPVFREQWLPNTLLSIAEPLSAIPDKEVRYRMRDDQPPFLESTVTFSVTPDASGGSRLTIVHQLDDVRVAANDGDAVMMCAA